MFGEKGDERIDIEEYENRDKANKKTKADLQAKKKNRKMEYQ